jgi:hypothetical protein
MLARVRAPALFRSDDRFRSTLVVTTMRAEHQALVDSIKQSVGLLRRHL